MLPRQIDDKTDRREFLLALGYGAVAFFGIDQICCIPVEAQNAFIPGTKKVGHTGYGNGSDGATTISANTSLTSTTDGGYIVSNTRRSR